MNVFHDQSKVPGILFADDNLIGNKRVLKNELLPALIKWREEKVPIFSFSTQVSINLADDEALMDMMLEAGFRHLFIGIETDAEETLKLTGKSQNLRRNVLKNIKTLHQKGFIVVGGFIVGFDTDTIHTFQNQLDLIQESGILLATVNMLKAPPGTPLYDRMKREDRLISGFSFGESETNFKPSMPTITLYTEFEKLIRQVYGAEPSLQRAKKWLDEFNHLPDVGTDVPSLNALEYLPVFLRAIYYLGLKWSERKVFWRLMGWTAKHHLRKLDWAIVDLILIYQLHFLMLDYSKSLQDQITRMRASENKRVPPK